MSTYEGTPNLYMLSSTELEALIKTSADSLARTWYHGHHAWPTHFNTIPSMFIVAVLQIKHCAQLFLLQHKAVIDGRSKDADVYECERKLIECHIASFAQY